MILLTSLKKKQMILNDSVKGECMLYPLLTKTRNTYDLGGIWNFKLGEHNPNELLPSDEVMVIPTSFNDLMVSKEKRDYIGDFWYEKVIEVPKVSEGEEMVLRFGSVTHQAKNLC